MFFITFYPRLRPHHRSSRTVFMSCVLLKCKCVGLWPGLSQRSGVSANTSPIYCSVRTLAAAAVAGAGRALSEAVARCQSTAPGPGDPHGTTEASGGR